MTVRELTGGVRDELGDASTVLLLAPSLSSGGGDVCADLLVPDEGADECALWVSYTKSPDEQVRRFRSRANGEPRQVGVINVDDSRSAATAAQSGASPDGPTETVTSPNDLTGLGIRITEYLREWNGVDGRTVVCFDSITAMLQYVDLQTAFEFLHVLTGRLASVGAFAHFHMDPTAHDDQTVQTLLTLFDAVVEVDADGGAPTVRKR
ncbi:DUF7504 family protein [Halobaculum sp. D14]|uniref:DUF7504 family protein n=1 Tax=unclassified Halobaculum TaxID=2640896 RepID=UPI003EBBAB42